MTYEDAKMWLRSSVTEYCSDCDGINELGCDRKCESLIALDMVIEVLEKQIPKQPTYEADGYANGELVYDTWYCPNCGKDYEVGYDDYDYCPSCGQRIDRSEVEE